MTVFFTSQATLLDKFTGPRALAIVAYVLWQGPRPDPGTDCTTYSEGVSVCVRSLIHATTQTCTNMPTPMESREPKGVSAAPQYLLPPNLTRTPVQVRAVRSQQNSAPLFLRLQGGSKHSSQVQDSLNAAFVQPFTNPIMACAPTVAPLARATPARQSKCQADHTQRVAQSDASPHE